MHPIDYAASTDAHRAAISAAHAIAASTFVHEGADYFYFRAFATVWGCPR